MSSSQQQGPRLPAWIVSGKLWYAVVAVGLLAFSFIGMLWLIPDTHNIKEALSEIAFHALKVTVITFVGLYVLGIILVTLSVVFDPLTIRRELMTLLMDWYERVQSRKNAKTAVKEDPADGLKLLAMAILSSSTIISVAIILAALYRAAF